MQLPALNPLDNAYLKYTADRKSITMAFERGDIALLSMMGTYTTRKVDGEKYDLPTHHRPPLPEKAERRERRQRVLMDECMYLQPVISVF